METAATSNFYLFSIFKYKKKKKKKTESRMGRYFQVTILLQNHIHTDIVQCYIEEPHQKYHLGIHVYDAPVLLLIFYYLYSKDMTGKGAVVYIYSRPSAARTLRANLPRLFRAHS